MYNYLRNKFEKSACTEIFFILFACLLYAPFWILYFSEGKYIFGYSLIAKLALVSAAIFISVSVTGLYAKTPFFIRCAIGAVALYVLISITFIPFRVGLLDGVEKKNTADIVIHLVLFLFIAVLFFYRHKKMKEILHITGVVSVAIFVFFFVSIEKNNSYAEIQRSNEVVYFSMGSEENVIILVNDMYQGAFVKALLNDNSELAETFDGFTFYQNTVSAGPYTTMSTRAVLRGKVEIESNAPASAIDPDDNLFADAVRGGFLCSYIGVTCPVAREGVAFRGGNSNYFLSPFEAYGRVILIGAARYAPQKFLDFLAPPLEFGWISKSDARDTLRKFAERMYIGEMKKKLLYFHSLATHQPIRFDKAGKYHKAMGHNGVYDELYFATMQLGNIIKKLKELSIYDNSTIIIMGDHGYNILKSMDSSVMTEDLQFLLHPLGENIIGQYDVTLLVKEKKSRGPLTFNKAPVVLSDLRKTLYAIIYGEESSTLEGVNFLSNKSTAVRSVPVLAYTLRDGGERMYGWFDGWEVKPLEIPLYKNIPTTQ